MSGRLRVLDLLQEEQVFVVDLLSPSLLVDLVARRLRLQAELLLVDVDGATRRVRRRDRRTATQAVMLFENFAQKDPVFAIDAFLSRMSNHLDRIRRKKSEQRKSESKSPESKYLRQKIRMIKKYVRLITKRIVIKG